MAGVRDGGSVYAGQAQTQAGGGEEEDRRARADRQQDHEEGCSGSQDQQHAVGPPFCGDDHADDPADQKAYPEEGGCELGSRFPDEACFQVVGRQPAHEGTLESLVADAHEQGPQKQGLPEEGESARPFCGRGRSRSGTGGVQVSCICRRGICPAVVALLSGSCSSFGTGGEVRFYKNSEDDSKDCDHGGQGHRVQPPAVRGQPVHGQNAKWREAGADGEEYVQGIDRAGLSFGIIADHSVVIVRDGPF